MYIIVLTILYNVNVEGVVFPFFVITILYMKSNRGAPKKSAAKSKGDHIQFRVNPAEKEAFERAADLDGKKLSEWIRDRLRRVSRQELEDHGQRVPFLPGKNQADLKE
jgi:hypothetical protein